MGTKKRHFESDSTSSSDEEPIIKMLNKNKNRKHPQRQRENKLIPKKPPIHSKNDDILQQKKDKKQVDHKSNTDSLRIPKFSNNGLIHRKPNLLRIPKKSTSHKIDVNKIKKILPQKRPNANHNDDDHAFLKPFQPTKKRKI